MAAHAAKGGVSYPPGHWMSLGIAMGIPVGVPVGLIAGFAMRDMGIGMMTGPAFGVAIGTGIGWVLERRHADEMRSFTPQERRISRNLGLVGIGALLIGLAMISAFALF